MCATTFRRDLLLHLNPYHIILAVTALQAATQLEVARRLFCVLRDEQLAIDRLAHVASPLLLLASSAVPLRYVPVLPAVYLSMSIAREKKKKAVNVFYAARLGRPLSNDDIPERY